MSSRPGGLEAEEVLEGSGGHGGADRGVLISVPGLADGGGRAAAQRAVAAADRAACAASLTGQASASAPDGSLPGRVAALLGGPVGLDAQCLELEAGGIVRALTRSGRPAPLPAAAPPGP